MRVTRRYRFAASHRLHSPELSDAQNQALYGKCNNPYGHGHDYVLEVSAEGVPDSQTGFILRRHDLDRLVEVEVLRLFANRNINGDVGQFSTLVPTTENISLVVAGILRDKWNAYLDGTRVRLVRVHIQETARNGFEVIVGEPPIQQQQSQSLYEGVALHA